MTKLPNKQNQPGGASNDIPKLIQIAKTSVTDPAARSALLQPQPFAHDSKPHSNFMVSNDT